MSDREEMVRDDGVISDAHNPSPSAESLTAEAFAELLRASFRLHWLIAYGIVGDGATAEDLVQDAAIVALTKLDQFQPGTNFNAWLGRVVKYVAMNHARKQQYRRTASLDEATASEGKPTTPAGGRGSAQGLPVSSASSAPRGILDERIVSGLDELADMARACLLLRTVEEMKYSEIAQLLDIPEGTAMSHVHRARRTLRERLSDLAPEGDETQEDRP